MKHNVGSQEVDIKKMYGKNRSVIISINKSATLFLKPPSF